MGAPRPSRASLESLRPQTIRAAAYASAEEPPFPLRACVGPRLRFDALHLETDGQWRVEAPLSATACHRFASPHGRSIDSDQVAWGRSGDEAQRKERRGDGELLG